MVKLKGPLLSIEAHGSVGSSLTFSERRSGPQVRFQHKQTDVQSDDQITQRTHYWAAIQWWKDLTTNERAEWNTLAAQAP